MKIPKRPQETPIPSEPGEVLRALVNHPRWMRPPGMLRVDLTQPDTTGHLLMMMQETGVFGFLLYNRQRKRWVVQFGTARGGAYPSDPMFPGVALAKALLHVWREQSSPS